MKRIALLSVLVGASFMTAAPKAQADVSVGISVNYFHDTLSPYGDWVRSERFGTVWAPRRVAHGWRPYYYGHWVYTDYDWTWVSDDDWGWATDHYGRWYFDPRLGWVWIPGQEWGPAWVAWRYGNGYVGWAPLPPDIDPYRSSFVDVRIDPFAFCFVEQRRVFEPSVYRHALPVARNVTIVNVTQNITNYTVVNNRVVNRGLDVRNVERSLGHAVPRVQVREAASISEARGARVKGGAVAVFRPRVESSAKAPVHEVKATRNEKAEEAMKREEKERKQLQSNEERERKDLHKIQERDNRQPEVLSMRRDDRDDKARIDSEKAQRERAERENAQRAKAEHDKDAREKVERQRADRERTERESRERARIAEQQQLRQRHDAELRAQAEHEQRERQALNERQDRERETRDRQRQAMERDRRDNQAPPATRQAEDRSKDERQQQQTKARPSPKPTPKPKHEGHH